MNVDSGEAKELREILSKSIPTLPERLRIAPQSAISHRRAVEWHGPKIGRNIT